MAKKRILIIEDEQSLMKNLSLILSDKYEVLESSNGVEGLAKAKAELPDLILLDITLPGMEGTEVLQELKNNSATANIEILVLTNLSDGDVVSKILEAGGKDYLVKADWSIDKIAEKVDLMLE